MAVSLADDGPQRPSDDGATRRAGVHRPGTLGAQVQVRAGLEHHRHPLGFALPAHQTLLLQKDVLAELFHCGRKGTLRIRNQAKGSKRGLGICNLKYEKRGLGICRLVMYEKRGLGICSLAMHEKRGFRNL